MLVLILEWVVVEVDGALRCSVGVVVNGELAFAVEPVEVVVGHLCKLTTAEF